MFEVIYDYYENYQLNDGVYIWELSDEDKNLLNACIWLLDNKASIRSTAKNCCYTKTVLHKLIHTRLKSLSFELYRCVLHQLAENKNKYFK